MAAPDWRWAVGGVELPDGRVGQCVLVSRRHVLTSRQLVRGGERPTIRFRETQPRATLLADSEEGEWALLELDREVEEGTPASLGLLPPDERPKVQSLVYTESMEPVELVGEVFDQAGDGGERRLLGRLFNGESVREMAGAPIVADGLTVVGFVVEHHGQGDVIARSLESFLAWAGDGLAGEPTFSMPYVQQDAEAPEPPADEDDNPPSAHIHRDRWTTRDSVGYRLYAVALGEFIRHRETQPPLVVGIQAPWGQGKTSLMRMIQQELDPGHPDLDAEPSPRRPPEEAVPQVTYGDAEDAVIGDAREPELGAKTRRTVWFNAWKYQNSEQLWAGLGHCIITQLTDRLPSQKDRELFWLRLQRDRVDVEAIRKRVHAMILEKLVPFAVLAALALIAGVGVALGYGLLSPWLTMGGAGGVGFVATAGGWLWARRAALAKPLEGAAAKYVREPDYDGKLGFLQLVERDLELVMARLVPEDEPAVVFIDDLDRCSPSKVAEVMEAVNMFLAGGFSRCIFVLGLDAEVVAAAMEVAHAEIVDKLPQRRRDLGWRFMDKFVQLPFVLPVLQPTQREDYLRRLLRAPDRAPADAQVTGQVNAFASEALASGRNLDDLQLRYEELLERIAGAGLEVRQQAGEAMIRGGARKIEDATEARTAGLERWLPHLSDNPRTIKRVVNLYRFQRFAAWARQAQDLDAADPQQIARWVVALVRWPHFVRWIQVQPHDEDDHPVDRAVRIARETEDLGEWAERVAQEYDPTPSWAADGQLHAYLRDEVEPELALRQATELGVW